MANPMITPAPTPAAQSPPPPAATAAELKSFIIQIFLPQPSRPGPQWVDIQPRSEIPESDMAVTAAASAEGEEEGNLQGSMVEELELYVRVRRTLVPVFYRTLSGEIDEMMGAEVQTAQTRRGGGEGNGERAGGGRIARARVRRWSREFVEECKEYKARYARRGQHDPSREFNVER